MSLEARCRTTAMGIMPHTDIEKALELALSLDIPYWPQLPKVNFYEDMYAQALQNFPGAVVDPVNEKIRFDTAKFEEEMDSYFQKMEQPETFALSRDYSVVYHEFLRRGLQGYHAIRGQLIGPISLGFKIMDEHRKPIIYNENVRPILFDFIQRKVNVQYSQLKERNNNAFVWLDEPGLGVVFSGMSGYTDIHAKEDYRDFLEYLEGPKAMHLCADVNLPYLLELGIELLSFDTYQMKGMPREYAKAVSEFLRGGGVISWGIVPTDSGNLSQETPETLARLLSDFWHKVSEETGLAVEEIAQQSLIAPSRCCLKDLGWLDLPDVASENQQRKQPSKVEEELVETAFAYLDKVSRILKDRYGIE